MIDIEIGMEIRERWIGEAILAVCHVQGCNNTFVSKAEFDREVAALVEILQAKGKAVLQESGVQRTRHNSAPCRIWIRPATGRRQKR